MRGVRLIHNGMSWSGVCHDEARKEASVLQNPREAFSPVNYSATLQTIFQTLLCMVRNGRFLLGRMRGTPTDIETPANLYF